VHQNVINFQQVTTGLTAVQEGDVTAWSRFGDVLAIKAMYLDNKWEYPLTCK